MKGAFGFIAKTNRLVADEKFREAGRESPLHQARAKNKSRCQAHLSQQAAQQIYSRLRRRIDFDLLDLGQLAAVRDENAVDRPVRRNRDAIDQRVNRIPEKFQTGDERDLERA